MTAAPALSPVKAARLAAALDPYLARWNPLRRVELDPVELPHRYHVPEDIEAVALLSASLAYGRVELFKPKIESLLAKMGPAPAAFIHALDVRGARDLLEGFVYRFNVPADLAVLLLGMGKALRRYGTLEGLFAAGWRRAPDLRSALGHFTRALRDAPHAAIRRALGPERGLDHLLPSPDAEGAAKRLNLFLRWMVRGPDAVDFGLWRAIPPSELIIPLDTHIHRIALHLGLTRRKSMGWRTAEEITASLRRLDPKDPIKYDFALCHYGMSGACPLRPGPNTCEACQLLPACRTGPAVLRRSRPLRSARSNSDR